MNLPALQYQVAQTTEVTSTLFMLLPIIVMMIPLLLMFFPLLALKPPFSWIVSAYQRLSHTR